MVDTYTIFSGIVLLSVYGMYKVKKYSKEKTQIIESQIDDPICEKAHESKKTDESQLKPIFELQTHHVKYWLYNYCDLESYSLRYLYHDIVVKNLWINEPFHSKFYEILMVLDKNEFMMIDPHSRVITMNVRGKDNKVSTSKSFQVFATRDIIEATLQNAMSDIVRFNKHDAQHIVLAICVIALEQSLHYQSHGVSLDTVKTILKDYEFTEDIYHITSLLEGQNEQLKFVNKAFQIAFETTQTEAYNDSEISKPLQLPTKLPQKVLQEV
ncbi:MAG: hypothetical protein KA253_04035 [Campylobacteraceae bacterium]|nr:hypothetical protein [Campylobacteraceae bacterium]